MVVAFVVVPTVASVAACLSLLTAAGERVASGRLKALAACWSWLVKALVLLSSSWLISSNSQYSGSSSSYLLVLLLAVILLLVWEGMVVVAEVMIGRGIVR